MCEETVFGRIVIKIVRVGQQTTKYLKKENDNVLLDFSNRRKQ